MPGDRPARHRPERHPQGVRRPRELHLPAPTLDAAHDRRVRLLRGGDPALEHDLDLRLPHPGGRLDGGAGARVHARARDRLLRRGRRGRALAGRLRRAALVLLQRAQRLLRRGREVPRRPAGSGRPSCATGSARRAPRPRRSGSTPRPAARRSPPSSPRATSCASRSRRSPPSAAARSPCTPTRFDEALALPTEHAATIALRTQQVLMHEAGTTETADPLGGSWLIEALTTELEQEATTLIERIDALGGAVAAIEAGFTQGEIEEAAFRYQQQVEDGSRVIVGVNRFQTDVGETHRPPPGRSRRRGAAAGAHGARPRRPERRDRCRGARRDPPASRRRTRTSSPPCVTRSAPAAPSARSARCCAISGARTTRGADGRA